MIRSKYVALMWLSCVGAAIGGMRIDLRPEGGTIFPGNPPRVYLLPGTHNVNVYLVDAGNPTLGDIRFRGLFLDFSNSSSSLTLSPQFQWTNPLNVGVVFPELPLTAWVYPMTVTHPLLQLTLPDNGEVLIGNFDVTLTAIPWGPFVLDVVNQNDFNANFGARADFGFGVLPDDPLTTWRAFTGEITGGRLQVSVIPEPATMVLLLSLLTVARRKSANRAFRFWDYMIREQE